MTAYSINVALLSLVGNGSVTCVTLTLSVTAINLATVTLPI